MGGGGEGDLQRGPQSVQSVPNSQYEEYSLPNPPSSHVLSREKLHVSLHMQPIGCLGGGGLGGGGGGHGGSDGGFGGDGGEGGGGGRGYTNVCPLQLGGCSVSNSGQAYRQRPIRTARALLNQRPRARRCVLALALSPNNTLEKAHNTALRPNEVFARGVTWRHPLPLIAFFTAFREDFLLHFQCRESWLSASGRCDTLRQSLISREPRRSI